MRVIFLAKPLTILLTFVVMGVIQVAAALVCINLPDRFFDPDAFLFRSHGFERNGQIYQTLFKVKLWKHLLPDGAAAWKKRGFRKKKLDNLSEENLERYLVESARGELTHWLAILPFWVFGFFTPPEVVPMMLAYALVINLPCILVQRYNRPRIKQLLDKLHEKPNGKMKSS